MAIEPKANSKTNKIKKIFGTLAAAVTLLSPFSSNASEQNNNYLEKNQTVQLRPTTFNSNYEQNVKDPNSKGFNVELEGKSRTEVLTLYSDGKPDIRFEPFPTKAGQKNALSRLLEHIEFEEKETFEINKIMEQITLKGYKVLEIPQTSKFISLILYKDKSQIQDVNIRIKDKKDTLFDFLRLIEEKEDEEKNELVRYLYERGYELIETPKTKDYISLRLRNISEDKDIGPETIVKNQDKNNTLRYLINELNKRR